MDKSVIPPKWHDDFYKNAYLNIFPDFFQAFKESGGSFEALLPALASVFYKSLGLSPSDSYFVALLNGNFSFEHELEAAYFESEAVDFGDYQDTARPIFKSLSSNQWSTTMVVAYDNAKGQPGGNSPKTVITMPISCGSTVYGYVAMFLHNDTEIDENSPQIKFIEDCVRLVGMARQGQTNDARFDYYLNNDYLTGLPNRNLMYESIVNSLQMAEMFFSKFAILSVKVGGLKQINDSLGMLTGDMALKAMSGVIADAVASVNIEGFEGGNVTGRMSGADFVVLVSLPSCVYEGNLIVSQYCEAIVTQTREPIEVNGHKLYLSTNVGAAIHPVHGEGAEEMLRKAEMARTVAKNEAPGTYLIYENFMGGDADDALWLNGNLPTAIEQNQFELFYQAKLDLEYGKIIGAEALIRWMHPEKGLLNPGAFVDFAERNNYGIQIDELVLDMACKQINLWKEKGFDFIVSVNISPRHFAGGLIYDTVKNVLENNNVNPSQLEIEILESIVVEDFDGTVKVVNDLRELGVRVSLDDFGSGYSSLEYVAKLPI
ncbi:MAG: EAL domain-containing protein, partial [Defluviitaleaceae bacterium]|nr:EAL domain-containing protein [Defluviitaleaceae bacterium]